MSAAEDLLATLRGQRIHTVLADPPWRFDNRTGKMVSANYVNCDARLEPERDTTPSENINRERIRAILGAFKK